VRDQAQRLGVVLQGSFAAGPVRQLRKHRADFGDDIRMEAAECDMRLRMVRRETERAFQAVPHFPGKSFRPRTGDRDRLAIASERLRVEIPCVRQIRCRGLQRLGSPARRDQHRQLPLLVLLDISCLDVRRLVRHVVAEQSQRGAELRRFREVAAVIGAPRVLQRRGGIFRPQLRRECWMR